MSPDLRAFAERWFGAEAGAFFACAAQAAPPMLRLNPNRGDGAFLQRRLGRHGLDIRPHPADPALFSFAPVDANPGAFLEHALGLYYLQDLSSALPVLILDPQPGERILDLAAAPGSKTTQMAARMNDTGLILANDISAGRVKALAANLDRLGVVNTLVTRMEGERIGGLLPERFDRVLLDAPCSALGIIGKEPEVLGWWHRGVVERLAPTQERLFRSAVTALKPGGRLVYSTCTLTPEENEARVDWALRECPLELEEIGHIPGIQPARDWWGRLGLDERLAGTLRLLPQDNAGQGFFVACFRKTGSDVPAPAMGQTPPKGGPEWIAPGKLRDLLARIEAEFSLDAGFLGRFAYSRQRELWLNSPDLDRAMLPFAQRAGLRMSGLLEDGRIKRVSSHFLQFLGDRIGSRRVDLDGEDWGAVRALMLGGTTHYTGTVRGQVAIFHDGLCLGAGLAQEGQIKSQIPRARRETVRVF